VRDWRLDELTHRMVRERDLEVAVLPIGSTEPHGLHLPYGSDTFHTTAVADQCCERAQELGANVVLLPTIPYGVDANLMGFPMAMHVSQAVLDAMVTDLVRTLEHYGFRKIVLLNGHGGNTFKGLLRELHNQVKPWVCLVDWWKVGSDRAAEIFTHAGDHADEFETSVNLALFADLVHMDDADDGAVNESRFEAVRRGWVQLTRPWHLLTKNAGVGDPREASVEKGEKILAVVVERLAEFLKELSDSPMDDTFPY